MLKERRLMKLIFKNVGNYGSLMVKAILNVFVMRLRSIKIRSRHFRWETVAMNGRVLWINTALPDWISSVEGSDYIHDALQGRCHGLGVEGARTVKMRWLVLR